MSFGARDGNWDFSVLKIMEGKCISLIVLSEESKCLLSAIFIRNRTNDTVTFLIKVAIVHKSSTIKPSLKYCILVYLLISNAISSLCGGGGVDCLQHKIDMTLSAIDLMQCALNRKMLKDFTYVWRVEWLCCGFLRNISNHKIAWNWKKICWTTSKWERTGAKMPERNERRRVAIWFGAHSTISLPTHNNLWFLALESSANYLSFDLSCLSVNYIVRLPLHTICISFGEYANSCDRMCDWWAINYTREPTYRSSFQGFPEKSYLVKLFLYFRR